MAPYGWIAALVLLADEALLPWRDARAGRPSFLAAWLAGDRASVRRWLIAGIVCGVLWELPAISDSRRSPSRSLRCIISSGPWPARSSSRTPAARSFTD